MPPFLRYALPHLYRLRSEEGQGDGGASPEPSEPDDIRSALSAAMDASDNAGNDAPADEEYGAPAADRARDERGRFAPKAGDDKPAEPQPEAPADQAAQPAVPAQPEAPKAKPPASFKPEEAAEWERTPPSVQAAVNRREAEVARFVQETSGHRQFSERMTQTLAPYMPLIQQEGGDPFRAVDSVLQTAAALRTAPPQQRAQLVAQIVSQYGIDIGMLDEALAAGPKPQQPDVTQLVQQQVAQALAPVRQFAQQQQEQVRKSAQTELQQFAADRPHFETVRQTMADLIEVATKRGQDMTLEQAYDAACQLHPDVRAAIVARSTAESAQRQTAAAQRARSAAVSVSGAPVRGTAGDSGPGESIRSALQHAFQTHAR